MTDIQLKAFRDHVFQLRDHVPQNERWRIEALGDELVNVMLYIRRLERQVNEAQDAAFYHRKRWDD